MNVYNAKDKLPEALMFGLESGEVLMWLIMENKWALGFYDYNNSVWQFAERGRPVSDFEHVSHWANLPSAIGEQS